MKKIIIGALLFLLFIVATSNYVFATDKLIENTKISLKTSENPNRLEVSFQLTEPIVLSKGSSNIIFEYFSKDSNGNLQAINYKKDNTWSGYLNSYDNYPSGERKYSTGSENNANYSDSIPATTIYTSTRTGSSIDVSQVAAIRITVLRENGSGEKLTIYNDGTITANEKIEVPVEDEDKDTGIIIESTTAQLPMNTILIVTPLTSGTTFDKVNTILTDAKDFVVYNITLESEGVEIQPNGHVTISIPIPEIFDTSNLIVYRIDTDGTKTPYEVTITIKDGKNYATFETNHFSTYVLTDTTEASEAVAEKDETPKTGVIQFTYYVIAIIIISAIGIIVSHKKTS